MDARPLPRRLVHARWLGIAGSSVVVIAWLFFLRSQLDALQEYSWQIDPLAFGTAVVFAACYFAGLAFCWALLLHRTSATSPAALGLIARIWLRSTITRYIPGNVWHILTRVAFAGQLQVSATQVLVSSSVEQLLTLMGALAVFGAMLPFWDLWPGTQSWLLLLLPIGLALLHPRIFGAALVWAAQRLGRPALAWQYRYRDLLLLLSAYYCVTLTAGLALYIVLNGLTVVQVAHLPLVIGAAALAWVVGYLSFITPSGLGVREAILVTLLSQIVPLPIATLSSLLFRLVLTLGEVVAVLLASLIDRLNKGIGRGYTS